MLEDTWKILSAYQRLVPEAVFAGCTAAWLYGIELRPIRPIEVIVPSRSSLRSRPGLTAHHIDLEIADIAHVRGVRATKIERTLVDVCASSVDVDALAAIDQALRMGLIDKANLNRHGYGRLRWLGSLAEPAESPMETRLRWLLFRSGLPRPRVQERLSDRQGRFLGRADLYYPQARLVVEFDGGNHRDRLVEDNRRQNLLLNAGYAMLRFTAADLHQRPETVVRHVRKALSAGAAVAARRPAAAPR